MRIIAGSLKGRKLTPPDNDAIRPTSDRTRENVFNLLMHGQFGGDNIIDKTVADLCCGTGALGLEAISRGAASCIFVDQSKAALALARQNAIHCGVSSKCNFVQADITKLPPTNTPASLIMMDPPYGKNIFDAAYAGLKQGGWFAEDALIVLEKALGRDTPELEGATLITERKYGKTIILIYSID